MPPEALLSALVGVAWAFEELAEMVEPFLVMVVFMVALAAGRALAVVEEEPKPRFFFFFLRAASLFFSFNLRAASALAATTRRWTRHQKRIRR